MDVIPEHLSSTPSSASQIKPQPVENAFPTPPFDTPARLASRNKAPPSPAPAKLLNFPRAASTPPETTNDKRFRSLSSALSEDSAGDHSWQRLQLARKKSQYYTDAFAYREPYHNAKDRVAKDSVVTAEVKLNCCVENEQEFLIDLSFQLSDIYRRPATCIMVMVSTEVGMLLGGTGDPAYHLTITALPSEIAETKNKRNTFLIQDFMKDTVEIPSNRGIIRYESVAEGNLATNGMTTLQEIEQLERQSSEDNGFIRTISRQSRRSKKSSMAMFTERAKTSTPLARTSTPSAQRRVTGESSDSKTTELSGPDAKRVKKRKSFMSLFRK